MLPIGSSGRQREGTACNLDRDGDGKPDVDRNLDGWDDRETYAIQNADTDEIFLNPQDRRTEEYITGRFG